MAHCLSSGLLIKLMSKHDPGAWSSLPVPGWPSLPFNFELPVLHGAGEPCRYQFGCSTRLRQQGSNSLRLSFMLSELCLWRTDGGPHAKRSLCHTFLFIVVTPQFCITQCLDWFSPKECILQGFSRLSASILFSCCTAAGPDKSQQQLPDISAIFWR